MLKKYTKEWLAQLCKDSYSYAEVLRKAGRQRSGGNQQILKREIQKFNIDISHFTHQGWVKSPNQSFKPDKEKYLLEEIFKKDSQVTQKVLRGYVKRHNLITYRCEFCECDGKWQDGIISLELDHIDGDTHNNELSNLRYLCPNCHALTNTYRGKNKALKRQCVEAIQ